MGQAGIAIKAEHKTALGHSCIAEFSLSESADQIVEASSLFMIDMAMSPRPGGARAQYSERWRSDRYEHLGKIWMAPPDEAMRFRSGPGVTRCVQCFLRPEAISCWLGEETDWSSVSLDGCFDVSNDRILAILRSLLCELNSPGLAAETMVELIIGQLAIEISRHLNRYRDGIESDGLVVWRRRIIEERLDANGVAPSLSELASLCGLSVRQLTRGFRASYGASIGDAITARRIENARQLLNSEEALKLISHRLGFASPSAFSQAFRKATGETPGVYRARLARDRLSGMARRW